MSLFSWFSRKPAPPKAKPRSGGAEPSGLMNADATVPLAPGRPGQPLLEPNPPEHAANRKNERMERRELLYTVVRDAMAVAMVNVPVIPLHHQTLQDRGGNRLFLAARGHNVPKALLERDVTQPMQEWPEMQDTLLELYRNHPVERGVCELLVDLLAHVHCEWPDAAAGPAAPTSCCSTCRADAFRVVRWRRLVNCGSEPHRFRIPS